MKQSLLAVELKQTKPLPLEQEAFTNLQRTAAVLMQQIEAHLGQREITPTQYNILRILRGAGSHGIRCGEIAKRLATPDPDVTRLLDRLLRRGCISRIRVEHDRRVVIVRITSTGQNILKDLDEPVLQLQRKYFRRLTRRETLSLNRLCEKLRRSEKH
jgi:DNA-binding MarR family transcriptional regulator